MNFGFIDVFLVLDLNKTRFKITWKNLPDLYFEESFAQIPICIPMPTLVFKGESFDGKEYIRATRLLRNAQNSFEVDKNFYPPLLYTGSYEYFAQKLRYFDTLLKPHRWHFPFKGIIANGFKIFESHTEIPIKHEGSFAIHDFLRDM